MAALVRQTCLRAFIGFIAYNCNPNVRATQHSSGAPEISGNWQHDHLGSVSAITDHTGAVLQRLAYDPFGKRRNTNGSYDEFGTIVMDWSTQPGLTDRGFTGHEHLDDIGLVHMNGRIFNPTLATFMQADPFVQDPGNLQNYNRYAYCFNNPLGCTDPSGTSACASRTNSTSSETSPASACETAG